MGIPRVDRSEEWFGSYHVEERLCVAGNSPPLVDLDLPVIIDNVKDLTFGIEAAKRDFSTRSRSQDAKSYLLPPHGSPRLARRKSSRDLFKHQDRNEQGL